MVDEFIRNMCVRLRIEEADRAKKCGIDLKSAIYFGGLPK